MNERTVFMEALEKETLAEQSAYLDEVCAGDPGLRQRVETLLKSHAEAGSFLGRPVPERLAEKFRSAEGAGETEEQRAGDVESASLEFLTSSQKPGSLGRLGHYEVLELIGRGGFGIVARAFDETLNRVVAIKVMAPQLATTSPPRKRFLREARAAAAIRHENVVTIYSVEEQPVPYLVMEYIDGQTLQQRIDETGPLGVREVLRIGYQIACGLSAAHEKGLIHRDIKPGNIMLERQIPQRVKVTDFGLARAADDASLTQSEVIAGTPMYMAPEQALNETIDHRADLFSLGSVLYLIVSGRPPFRAAGTLAVLKRVTEDTPRPIQEIIPETPDWLCATIAKLQAKDPNQRYQSASEVADVLSGYLAHLDDPSLTPQPLVHTPAKPRRLRRLARWSTAALVPLLLGGLGLAEATGITHVARTAIRIFTAEGTLLVEVDDPAVKVTIEGDGGVVITGAGPQELRLRSGLYKVRASKDGKPVHPEELVTISRGDHRVVRVSREPDRTAVPAQAGTPELQAFSVLETNGRLLRKFATLAEAVQGASDGDTIEIHGNGPFVSVPITIINQALTIRAGPGFRPVIRRMENPPSDTPLLQTNAHLLLEGLEFQMPDFKDVQPRHLIVCRGDSIQAAHCRFVIPGVGSAIIAGDSPLATARNCEFLGGRWGALSPYHPPSGARRVMENCVVAGCTAIGMSYWKPGLRDINAILRHNTFIAPYHPAVDIRLEALVKFPGATPDGPPFSIDAAANIMNANLLMWFDQCGNEHIIAPANIEAAVRLLVTWREHRNLDSPGSAYLVYLVADKFQDYRLFETRAAWDHIWGSGPTGSLEGRVRYQGGDLLARLASGPGQLTPDDFRLRPDSAGYRAGEDGKDLGADVDLVGPGPPYERWKKMPDYQQWLQDTGQRK
jgi:serine/threonine protein kinase